MRNTHRASRGEPLELEIEPLRLSNRRSAPLDARQLLQDLATLGRIGFALTAPPPRPRRSDVIDMREIAPGVFVRAENPARRPAGPLARLQQLERVLASQMRRGGR